MSHDLYVHGFRPPDKEWEQMQAVWESCKAAGVEIPQAVIDFFDDGAPDPGGICVQLPLTEWGDGNWQGYELKVADIPPQVTTLRFVMD